jgi:hypothetical protein
VSWVSRREGVPSGHPYSHHTTPHHTTSRVRQMTAQLPDWRARNRDASPVRRLSAQLSPPTLDHSATARLVNVTNVSRHPSRYRGNERIVVVRALLDGVDYFVPMTSILMTIEYVACRLRLSRVKGTCTRTRTYAHLPWTGRSKNGAHAVPGYVTSRLRPHRATYRMDPFQSLHGYCSGHVRRVPEAEGRDLHCKCACQCKQPSIGADPTCACLRRQRP